MSYTKNTSTVHGLIYNITIHSIYELKIEITPLAYGYVMALSSDKQ